MRTKLTHLEMVIILTEEVAKLNNPELKSRFEGDESRLLQACMQRAFNHGLELGREEKTETAVAQADGVP